MEEDKLNVKSALRSVLMALLLSMLIITPDVAHVIVFPDRSVGNADSLQSSPAAYPSGRVFLNQTFDNETVGTIPKDWYVANPQYGNITVASGGYGGTARSAMIVDNSSVGDPRPYRYSAEQTSTVGVSFAIKPTNNSGSNTVIEVFVDDGSLNGGNIVFMEGKIGYREEYGSIFFLRSSYVPDRWYNVKMILNIPRNVYNIYIDDHLEAVDAGFFGTCTQLHRLAFNVTSGQDGLLLPVAYIDEILGRQVIEIPKDYATIQRGLDAASENDIVFVTGPRTYYESVTVTKSIELVGEDASTTVIDGSLAAPNSASDGVLIQANNVKMHGFTVRSTPYGAGIRIQSWNNTIWNNIVTNGLGDGINIAGSGNYLAGNTIKSNLKYGVQVTGSDITLTNNVIESNDACGIRISGSNYTIEDNFIGSNLDCGIWITVSDHSLVRNNTIRKNKLGIRCDAGTQNNRIYQNRFIGNDQTPQAVDNGANVWDDGYPYRPDNETGGGNYWSDFDCYDLYSGAYQNEHGLGCSSLPDGVSDIPYRLSSSIRDRYPLFVIQNVTQNPENVIQCGANTVVNIEYDTSVKVKVTVLKNVTITAAFILVDYDSSHENSTINKDTLEGTISPKKYASTVRYNISVHAELAVEVNSTNYPLGGAYYVGDKKPPTIDNVIRSPLAPDDNQTIRVWAHVTEPANASGVDGVFLSYQFNDTVWTASMTNIADDNFTALMPRQPGNATLFFNVSAVDKAGNRNYNSSSRFVNRLPELSVSNGTASTEPCSIDLGVMYRGEKRTNANLTISNTGQEVLAWNITLVKDGSWLKSILPSSGGYTLRPTNSTTVAISVDTTSCLDPNLYVAELAVTANGSVPRWTVTIRLTVRDIAIDDSWCSKPAPQRSNVNEIQYFAFHAKWTHNCTDAVLGRIKLNDTTMGDKGWVDVNSTGWANFSNKSLSPVNKTFSVTDVDFNYTDEGQVYHIRSFTQEASNLTTTWDRVKVVLKIADDRIDVGSVANIRWNDSVYEIDNSPFAGFALLNDTLIKNTVGRYCITTSRIIDTKYGLTAFQSNTVCCIWDRIKLIGGGTSSEQTQVGKSVKVWLIGIYEYDNTLLKQGNGTLFLDVYDFDMNTRTWQSRMNCDEMDWSALNDRWEKSYSYDTQGTRRFSVSKCIEDRLYSLTVIIDLVGPLDITWTGGGWTLWNPWGTPSNSAQTSSDSTNSSSLSQPVPVQGSLEVPVWAAAAIALTLIIGMVLTLAVLLMSGKQRNRKGMNNQPKGKVSK